MPGVNYQVHVENNDTATISYAQYLYAEVWVVTSIVKNIEIALIILPRFDLMLLHRLLWDSVVHWVRRPPIDYISRNSVVLIAVPTYCSEKCNAMRWQGSHVNRRCELGAGSYPGLCLPYHFDRHFSVNWLREPAPTVPN